MQLVGAWGATLGGEGVVGLLPLLSQESDAKMKRNVSPIGISRLREWGGGKIFHVNDIGERAGKGGVVAAAPRCPSRGSEYMRLIG